MCIICQKKYDINNSKLVCNYCINLAFIPDTFINLTILYCGGCTSLTTIPYFSSLIQLYCRRCTSLATIPNTLINLTHFDCSGCISLDTIPDTLINLTHFDCSGCISLATIPNTLINLTTFDCSGCINLVTIPDTLINLTQLYCNYCINLTFIPNTFINILTLYCRGCTSLTTILSFASDGDTFISKGKSVGQVYKTNEVAKPQSITLLDCSYCTSLIKIPRKINHVECIGCKWLNHFYNKNYDFNIKKIKIISSWFRKNLKYFIFKRWIKSEEGVKWLYDPNNIGGKVSKLAIMRSMIT